MYLRRWWPNIFMYNLVSRVVAVVSETANDVHVVIVQLLVSFLTHKVGLRYIICANRLLILVNLKIVCWLVISVVLWLYPKSLLSVCLWWLFPRRHFRLISNRRQSRGRILFCSQRWISRLSNRWDPSIRRFLLSKWALMHHPWIRGRWFPLSFISLQNLFDIEQCLIDCFISLGHRGLRNQVARWAHNVYESARRLQVLYWNLVWISVIEGIDASRGVNATLHT
jgi:hypothetical protein